MRELKKVLSQFESGPSSNLNVGMGAPRFQLRGPFLGSAVPRRVACRRAVPCYVSRRRAASSRRAVLRWPVECHRAAPCCAAPQSQVASPFRGGRHVSHASHASARPAGQTTPNYPKHPKMRVARRSGETSQTARPTRSARVASRRRGNFNYLSASRSSNSLTSPCQSK